MLDILEMDTERLRQIDELKKELDAQEKLGIKCNPDRIDEIIMELDILEGTYEDGISDEEILRRFKENESKKKFRLSYGFKKIAFVAACVAIVFSLGIVALAKTSIWGDIANWGKRILHMPLNEKITNENTDIIKTNNSRTYNSIAEAIEKENLDIVYPKWLPDDIKEKKVVIAEYSDYTVINVVYEQFDNNYSFLISIDSRESDFVIDNAMEQYYVGNVIHYMIEQDESIYVMWQIGDYRYSISFKGDKEILIKIIDSIYIR